MEVCELGKLANDETCSSIEHTVEPRPASFQNIMMIP